MHKMAGRFHLNAKTLIEEADMPYTPVSRAVSSEDLKWADVVLTMTEAHKAMLFHIPTQKRNTKHLH